MARVLGSRGERISAVMARASGSRLGELEARWLSRLLWTGGAAWLAIFLLGILPFPHGQKPYAVLLLAAPLLFLAPLASGLAILWLIILRRFAGGAKVAPPP